MNLPKWIKQILEQFGHACWGAAIAGPAAYYGGALWFCAIWAGLCILPRELIDQFPINRPWDTVLDIFFFMIGGLLISLLIGCSSPSKAYIDGCVKGMNTRLPREVFEYTMIYGGPDAMIEVGDEVVLRKDLEYCLNQEAAR